MVFIHQYMGVLKNIYMYRYIGARARGPNFGIMNWLRHVLQALRLDGFSFCH